MINKNDPTAEPEKAYFVLDNLAPPRTPQYPLAKNTHDFRDPSGAIQPFDFIHGEAREVPLFVAQRCEEENAKVPQGQAKPFHISYGDPSSKPFDSADPSVLTLAEVVASIRVKAPKEAGVLMEKLEAAITVAIDQHTAQSKETIEAMTAKLDEALAAGTVQPGAAMALSPDQVIAGLDELHRDALLARAQRYGDEAGHFNGGSTKVALTDFLIEKAKTLQQTVPAPPAPLDVA